MGIAIAAGWATFGCSFTLDFDPKEGHPCDSSKRCLSGYECVASVCQEADTGLVPCDPGCAGAQKCDTRVGVCTDWCGASVCPTGQGCDEDSTACEDLQSGLGARCVSDADCAGAVPGCSTDPASPAEVLCICFTTINGGGGVCLGLPAQADDCEACGDARCLTARFSNTGASILCAPGGFRACASDVECSDSDQAAGSHCSLLAWVDDPGNRGPGDPDPGFPALGFLSACISPSAGVEVGATCDSTDLDPCVTGLCLPSTGDTEVCTHACSTDRGCLGGRSCAEATLDITLGGGRVFDAVNVCVGALTLGAPCDAAAGGTAVCGTDAPLCLPDPVDSAPRCTRACLDDFDCAEGQGFSCRPATNSCH